jgi:2-oxoisovalerate dehydrogenase E2 component (dihydrolipoyl transacylase)
MSRYVFKMPDLGEGTVEAEIVAWHVKVGETVQEDQVMVEVMTDKAAVEVPAPVTGKVVSLTGGPGDMVRVGAELIVFETDADAGGDQVAAAPAAATSNASVSATPAAAASTAAPARSPGGPVLASVPAARGAHADRTAAVGGRVKASPATRRRAREAGIDLRLVAGSGPQGRILRHDLESALGNGSAAASESAPGAAGAVVGSGATLQRRTGTEEIKVIGLRRLIANRMTEAKRNIPHFAYVEEVDVTELESLRRHLNRGDSLFAKANRVSDDPGKREASPLTYLPFIVAALARVVEQFPQCNGHYDAERNIIVRHRAMHVGIATQTPDGLKVPVVRHAEARGLQDLAAEIRRVSDAAKTGRATREELTGSTITVTSLGKLGGIVSTPIINAPELAIIGVNKAIDRPVIVDGAVAVRRMMNLSSSFDHRFVDGFDAAAMIQSLKEMLEHPATIFLRG